MTRRTAVALVVDASVARAAGDRDALASACRDALSAILDHGLVLATSDGLHEEWRRHRSRFSHKWLYSMYARRQVWKVDPPPHLPVRNALATLMDDKREAATKDLALVETALAADRRIVSRDDDARSIYGQLSAMAGDLRSVHWANPILPPCLEWLGEGAPECPSLCLGQSAGA